MQCASSTATSAGRSAFTSASRDGEASCSGVMNRKRALPSRISCSAAACRAGVSAELTRTARSRGLARSFSAAIWSCCRASSGEMTTVGPLSRVAGTW
jgi:hypothetical protein